MVVVDHPCWREIVCIGKFEREREREREGEEGGVELSKNKSSKIE